MNGGGGGRRVVVILQGGIGNQLFQLCAGETIRKRTGCDVAFDCELGFRNDASGRRFELASLIPAERRARPAAAGGRWRNALQERLAVTVEQRLLFRRGICSLPMGAALGMVRWWPGPEVVCRSCFQLLEYVDGDTVGRIRVAMGPGAAGGAGEVAVHLRQARDLDRNGEKMPEHAGTVLGMGYYRRALAAVRAEVPGARFRVFSDSGRIPENLFEDGDKVVVDEPKPGEAPARVLSRMAGCGHFVIANSTFSWWAAYLGEAAGKRVYAPREWLFHRQAPAQRGIFPADWHRL